MYSYFVRNNKSLKKQETTTHEENNFNDCIHF
jgi:hypothetical protein